MTDRDLSPVIRLDARDNVVVARLDVPAGTFVGAENLTTLNDIPSGHKIATRFIRQGEPILKYGTIIGYASGDTPAGTHMHSHNIEFGEVEKDYAFSRDYRPVELLASAQRATFQGILREDGQVATRNYIGVFVVSNCGATAARKIANGFPRERLAAFPNVDGVVPFIHGLGCGMEMSGEPMDLLRRTIAGYIRHPNIAAAVVIALGCERNNLQDFLDAQALEVGPRLKTLVLQDLGGVNKTIEAGRAIIGDMLPEANRTLRRPLSAEHLKVGLQCGGSDGFSGLSANPALGAAMDMLVRHGGTAILSETPEIFGVEHTLTARAVNPAVGRKLVERMNWWLKYDEGRDCQINGRVSPGNNAGGLANVLEKSLGGAKKGGSSPLMEVYRYAEPVASHGLVFMDTPGFDPVAATGQIAGGANLIAFTTGRGSCFGSVPVPTVKLASNTPMFTRMQDDMDINCGAIIDGDSSIAEMGKIVFEKILRSASGEKTKSEISGVGEDEFVPWPIGVLA